MGGLKKLIYTVISTLLLQGNIDISVCMLLVYISLDLQFLYSIAGNSLYHLGNLYYGNFCLI